MKNKSPKQSALDIVSHFGFPVFPCKQDKSPLTPHGFKDATTDIYKIQEYWNKHPNALIGVPTGAITGLFVIDIDNGNGKTGETTFKARGYEDPSTIQTNTRSGGRHLFFKYDSSIPNQTKANKLGKFIDTRGDGGYVIWAGSNGYTYRTGFDPSLQIISPIPDNIKSDLIGNQRLIPEGQRNETIFKNCISLVKNDISDDVVKKAASQLNQYCVTPLDAKEIEQISKSAIKYRHNNFLNSNISNSLLPLTDLGNGKRFARDHSESALYCVEQKDWYAFENGRWSRDNLAVNKMAEKTTKDIKAESMNSLEFMDQIKKWAKTSENMSRQKAMLDAARHHLDFNVSQFNQNKFLFNLNNVTYDLKKFLIKNQDYKDYITLKSNIIYDLKSKCPLWQKFLQEITMEDQELQTYLQKLCGYCLIGKRNEQFIIFIVGPGANGKSVFINTLSYVFGEYAGIISARPLISGSNGSIPSDIASLYGKRLVTLSEFPEETHLNTTLIKSITGGDRLTARHLYQSWFEFNPEFVLICAMNQIPEIREDDLAFFRRLKIIEFIKSFSKDEIDKDLPSKLKNEASGIFNWCVEGYRKYCKEGLEDTNSIRGSVKRFIQRNNPLVDYFESQIKVTNKQGDYLTIDSIRVSVDNFSESLYGKNITPSQIYKFFRSKGLYPSQKREGGSRVRCYKGIKFREEAEQLTIY